jgi:hypothetical protein
VRISHYSFGRITIDGQTYTSDVIILPGRVEPSWWRKEGHLLQPEDLEAVVGAGIGTLIVGTGASGVMRVPEETLRFLASRDVVVHALRTAEAVEMYNGTKEQGSLAAALHLTC